MVSYIRHMVQLRVVQAVDQVVAPGPDVNHRVTESPGRLGVRRGHERRGLLVMHQEEPDPVRMPRKPSMIPLMPSPAARKRCRPPSQPAARSAHQTLSVLRHSPLPGIELFDRTQRYPKLTPAGALIVADARSVVANVGVLKARAKGISGGLEPELSAVVDVLFPIEVIAESALQFREQFPHTPLRLYVEALGGAYQPVIDGRCSLGVVGSLPNAPASMSVEPLPAVDMIMVAARNHPLAQLTGVISKSELAKHVQLVLTDRSELTRGREFGVMSPLTWRLSDLFAKHSFCSKVSGGAVCRCTPSSRICKIRNS